MCETIIDEPIRQVATCSLSAWKIRIVESAIGSLSLRIVDMLPLYIVATILEWDHTQPECSINLHPFSPLNSRDICLHNVGGLHLESSRLRNHTGNEPVTINYQWMFVGEWTTPDLRCQQKQEIDARSIHVLVVLKWLRTMNLAIEGAEMSRYNKISIDKTIASQTCEG